MVPEAAGTAVGRRMGDGAVGVIDVGSNSVRLVLYERASRAPATLFNEKVLAALGEDLTEAGRLSDKAMERALTAIRRFLVIAKSADAKALTIVATAAARVAANGPEFIQRRSFEIFMIATAAVLSCPENATIASWLLRLKKKFSLELKLIFVDWDRLLANLSAKRGSALIPVPTAVPP